MIFNLTLEPPKDLARVETWTATQILVFCAIHIVLLEVFQNGIIMNFGLLTPQRIPIQAAHLDEFTLKDKFFIVTNRLWTPLLTYSLIWFTYTHPEHVEWDMKKMTVWNTLGSLVGFFAFYDLFYTAFHWALHIRVFYPWVHKHHHRQHAPTRGNLDAVNVHTFEFVTGEMLHLVCVMAIPCHITAVCVFVILAGIGASLNHTRFDVSIPGIYYVKSHDVHHRLITWNYGQYTMFWDKVFGTFRDAGNFDELAEKKRLKAERMAKEGQQQSKDE